MDKYISLCKPILDMDPETVTEYQLGNEAISFNSMRDHFLKVNLQANKILGYFTDDSDDFKITSLSLRDITLKKEVVSAGYMAIMDVEVFKPSAFTGNTHKFVTMLSRLSPHIMMLNESLVHFEATLSKLVYAPKDLTKPLAGLNRVKLPSGKKVLEDFGEYFMGRSGIDVVKVKNIHGNIKDIMGTGEKLLKLTEKFNGNDIATLRTRGDALYKTLQYLEDELEEQGLEMTKKWRKAIGAELYTITEWLGIYSMFITKLVATSQSHRDSINKLNSL